MIVGVPKETFEGETRVALVPGSLAALAKAGCEVIVEQGAGTAAGYADDAFGAKGARIADREEVYGTADVVARVRVAGGDPEGSSADEGRLRNGQAVIGFCEPLSEPAAAERFAATGASLLSMELMPRITRAQTMDALSSMATIAGYKAVLLAANHLPKMFPMMMTAAGTIKPAKVFVVGAGVAGLQAIATARKNGGVVEAYDVRPAVKEQVQSLGAKFVEMELETGAAEDASGYAKQLGEEFYRRQRELMHTVVAASDVVITTAAIPGKKAPVLVTADMVRAMPLGSVIVDLAAERGGNCELTRAGETVVEGGVTILGPVNVPATVPFHASQMYAKNVTTFLLHLIEDGALSLERDDEIVQGTLVAHGGKVVHERVLQALGAAGEGSDAS